MTAAAWIPEFCLLLAAAIWSIASGVYKRASAGGRVLEVNLFRCLVAVVMGSATVAVIGGAGRLATVPPRTLGWMLLSGVLARLVGDSLFFFSASLIGIARAMPIAAIYPVWSVLIARVGGEPVSLRDLLAMGCTLAGVVLVIRSGAGERTRPGRARVRNASRGYALAIACSLAWAFGLLTTKWGTGGLEPFLVNTVRMAAGAVAIAAVLFVQGRSLFPRLPAGRLPLLGASFLESWLGSAAYVYGVAHTSTAVGATLSSLAPVFTIPVAIWYLREPMSLQLVTGILLATAGVIGLMA